MGTKETSLWWERGVERNRGDGRKEVERRGGKEVERRGCAVHCSFP